MSQIATIAKRSPELKAALTEFLVEHRAVVLERVITAQTPEDLMQVKGAAAEMTMLMRTVANW